MHDFYIKVHKGTESSTRRLIANNMFLTFFPRYALEAITLVMISIIILFRSNIFVESESIVPTLGALGVCMQKLLPAFQSLYTSWATISHQRSSILKLIKFIELEDKAGHYSNYQIIKERDKNNILDFQKLELSNIFFRYESKRDYLFKRFNLVLTKVKNR